MGAVLAIVEVSGISIRQLTIPKGFATITHTTPPATIVSICYSWMVLPVGSERLIRVKTGGPTPDNGANRLLSVESTAGQTR